MSEETTVLTVAGSKVKKSVEFWISKEHPWRLRATFSDETSISVEDSDLFECLSRVRGFIEREGGLICCEGSRIDVFPSGMSRQMSGGRYAYRRAMGDPDCVPMLVDIFASAPCDAVVTVSEQIAAVRRSRRAGKSESR